MSPNIWYHVAATYNGASTRLYVNGVEDGLRPGVWSSANAPPLSIGQRGSNEDFFNGLIDEVEIFNRALSIAEIQSLYNAGSFGKCQPALANASAGQCSTVVNYTAPSFSDNCTTASISCSPASGTLFQKGATTVNCTISDTAGNSFANAFVVRVSDREAPVIACPSSVVVSANSGQCSAVVNYTVPTASDNCTTVNTACSPAPGYAFPRGTTTVTCTASDAANNRTTCSFTARVFDYVIVDDSNGKILRFDSLTGDYDFFDCRKNTSLSGRGETTLSNCKVELRHTGSDPKRPDRNLSATANPCSRTGTASLSYAAESHTLTDANLSNNIIRCP